MVGRSSAGSIFALFSRLSSGSSPFVAVVDYFTHAITSRGPDGHTDASSLQPVIFTKYGTNNTTSTSPDGYAFGFGVPFALEDRLVFLGMGE